MSTPRVWSAQVRDVRDLPAFASITINEAGQVVVIAPAPGSFSADTREAGLFLDAFEEALAEATGRREQS